MKKILIILSIFILVLISCLPVFAQNAPITHTYLVSDDGDYVFETVITSTVSTMYKPILAMYDSRGALCGLTIGNNIYVAKGVNKSLTIRVAPQATPQTVKLMLWSSDGTPVPISQFELVPTAVCDQDFGTIANVQLTNIKSRNYTFEGVFKSPINANYTPVIRMYDASGNICGFYEGPDITLSAGQRKLQEFTVYSTSTPAKIYFTLRNGTDVGQFSNIATSVSTEKFGVILEADSTNGIKLFATDGTYKYYDFADNFVLSYGNTLITDKKAAYDYLDTLRLKSYNRYADKDTSGAYTKVWTPRYDWLLFFDVSGDDARYIEAIPTPDEKYYYVNLSSTNDIKDSNIYKYSHFLNNYAKRMVRVSISPDGKITSMAFPGDSFFAKLTSGNAYSEVFYDKPNSMFSNKLTVKSNAKVLYLPTKKNATAGDFKALSPSELGDGNSYYVKEFNTSSNEQIILITYMMSESEITALNEKSIKNINIALNGNGNTAPGIKNHMFSISLTNQPIANNDRANALANTAMSNVAKGLEGALINAQQGYCITKDYIKIKYSVEIDAAKSAIRELQEMDTLYNASYYNELQNEISSVVEGNALAFLKEYFLD